MNPLVLFQPLPQGTTSATLRRFYSIKEHIQLASEVTVRVFANESASALRTLLQTAVSQCVIHVYVYPIESSSVEVTLVQDGKESHLKTCNIEPASDILKLAPLEENQRRQWRDLLSAYREEPYLVDVPTPETNHLFHQWIAKTTTLSFKSILMDDLIDAVYTMLEAKTAHPFDEAYVMQTTAIAGVFFAGSLRQWSDTKRTEKLAAASLAFGPHLPLTAETITALEAFIWEQE